MEGEKKKILIVDDDNFLLDMYALKFSQNNFEVYTAEGGSQVIEKLKGGAKFEELAKASKDPGSAEQGGDLGWAPSDAFVKPFSEAMMSLKAGEVTPAPVKTQFGFHVIKLEEMRDSQLPPFEQVKAQIAESLQQRKLQTYQQELKKKAKIQ
jgi:peptidyl-prolyl cis-trans isomerase C